MRLLRSSPWRIAMASILIVAIATTVVSAHLSGAGAADHEAVWTVAGAGSGTVVAIALVTLFVSRRATRSLHSLTQGVERLAAGDLDYRVEALSESETQELAQAFNTMAATLRGSIQALTGERNKLSAVLATMADGVVVLDSEGRVELFNPAAELLLGLPSQNTVGANFIERVRDHDLQRLVSQCRQTGLSQRGQVGLLHPNRELGATATPVPERVGTGVLLTLHDLTELRKLETTRREFVSNVSHELRTPIAAVKAMAETLQAGALEEQKTARDFINRILREADRMGLMVNELLELSRLESGRVALQLRPVNLRALVEDVVAQFQALSTAKAITLVVALSDGLPFLAAEEEKLRQVLVNLLDNALKFTSPHGVVTVHAEERGSAVAVSVQDTGSGIPREHLPHIFERFYKADRSRRDSGAGLGLAIVKHIVQTHGGTVDAESQEGVGSVFTFTIPKAA
ncbi:MAG: HAMP domain-containing protein [Dehalococcoidia bacterium]|nr:HAMP domain-containing protein [Dehalococcoidia bacterium]